MQDAWRAYLELAMGLTEAPRKKAQDAVVRVVGQGGATAAQLQTLAEELVATGLANRESLTKLVRFEVDRALGAVGLATADEVAELTRRVHDLERQLREARGHLGPGDTPSAGASEPAAAAPSGTAAAPSGATAPKTEPSEAGQPNTAAPAAETPATTPTKAVAKKTVAKKAIAKKPSATVARTPADGSPAAPARPAKKATGRRAAGS
ncbi:phasin family protein [Micromonospora aurantiaca (nom. illeg.)]|uniref:phasin family protein n=1 Tax=Micromonospora aurantiaca (nom. illeg.) TaxID=47850 RepID=UPI0033C50BC4